jgi:hypothetical protein
LQSVLAIVGSAFLFKAKLGRFCVLTTLNTGTDDNCTTYLTPDKKITTVLGAIWKLNPSCFDGNKTACTAANNHLCTVTARLTDD